MNKEQDSLNGHIGANIRKIRCERKLSQAELAKILEISLYPLQATEKGQTQIMSELLEALSWALGVGYSDFFA